MQKPQLLLKSQTNPSQLPNVKIKMQKIKKYHHSFNTARINMKQSQKKSLFLEKVKKEVNPSFQYQYAENIMIKQERKKLKYLLKNLNNQTMHIVDNFIHSSFLTKTKEKPLKQILQVKSEEIRNSNFIIELCQKQINKLQEKCQHLKYITPQEMDLEIQEKIVQSKNIKNQIKNLNRTVTLNGLQIIKDEQFNLVKQLQLDLSITSGKKNKLSTDIQNIEKRKEIVKQKLVELEEKCIDNQDQYGSIGKYKALQDSQQQLRKQNQNKQIIKVHQQRQLELKSRNLRHKCLQKLKNLEQIVKKCESIEINIIDLDEKIDDSRRDLVKYEKLFMSLTMQGKNAVKQLITHPSLPSLPQNQLN